eukprot:TRINITY_DN31376_c0_g3_i1.p1 TRINITY_DN31376_c0_g3~~TRINITY_DN31376_c0_g3_i1.p1  ORF type:complete len:314 (+),score=81.25 TRINITY_DN31376_c0_g3_i1:119-943(+)
MKKKEPEQTKTKQQIDADNVEIIKQQTSVSYFLSNTIRRKTFLDALFLYELGCITAYFAGRESSTIISLVFSGCSAALFTQSHTSFAEDTHFQQHIPGPYHGVVVVLFVRVLFLTNSSVVHLTCAGVFLAVLGLLQLYSSGEDNIPRAKNDSAELAHLKSSVAPWATFFSWMASLLFCLGGLLLKSQLLLVFGVLGIYGGILAFFSKITRDTGALLMLFIVVGVLTIFTGLRIQTIMNSFFPGHSSAFIQVFSRTALFIFEPGVLSRIIKFLSP